VQLIVYDDSAAAFKVDRGRSSVAGELLRLRPKPPARLIRLMMHHPVQTVLSIARQPLDAARDYSLAKLRSDVVAGLTVSVVAVPQSMAYAEIAGVPLEYGLYTVIIQCLIGSLFNSQKFLSVGPINTQSLLVFATVAAILEPGTPGFLEAVIALTLIKGLMQMTMAALSLGNLVRYVSRSVIVGFTAGAGVLIASKQIKNFLSVSPVQPEELGDRMPGLIGIFRSLIPVLDQAQWQSIVLGLVALGLVVGARLIHRLVPGPLLAVVFAGAIVAVMGWADSGVFLVEQLPQALPGFTLPRINWGQAEALLAGAVALSLLGLMEAYSIGQTIAARTGQRISANQELLSQGFTNFVSSFFRCIPGSGSFSRSALNYYAGARTLFAGVFNSIFVAVIFLAFGPLATYVPMAALAAILFVIAYGLIDWQAFLRMKRSNRADAIVCAATFVFTLLLPLQYAVFVGIALNIALYLRRASRLHMREMVRSQGGPFQERPITDATGRSSVVFLSLEGDLFFGVADELADQLNQAAGSGVRVVILRLKRTHMIDATVLSVLESFVRTMRERDGYVVLCGLTEEMHRVIQRYGLEAMIGPENVFETRFGVFASARAALARARDLVGHSIDAGSVLDEDEAQAERRDLPRDGAWYYQI
jgi:SulP family sulfate permease